jgi:hypothetical protein
MWNKRSELSNVLLGGALWLGVAIWMAPSPFDFGWPWLLVLLGAAVVVPLGRILTVAYFPELRPSGWCGVTLVWAQSSLASQRWLSAAAALPWLAVTGLMAWHALCAWRKTALAGRVALWGWMQLAIGGAWCWADRSSLEPMGFDGVIVRLTAAHFHFAGFFLPLLAALLLQKSSSVSLKFAAVGSAAGVMFVALGITFSKLGAPIQVEAALALMFCGWVLWLGIHYWLRAVQLKNPFLVLSSMALLAGMLLAAGYAVRPWHHFPLLQLPFMWAVHGSLQVFGFTLFAIMGWLREKN